MLDTQAFIQDIKSAAEIEAQAIIEAANASEQKALAELDIELDKLALIEKEKASLEASELLKHNAVSTRHSISNTTLVTKQKILQKTYDKAKKAIADMPDKTYLDFIKGLIYKHATNGDAVVIALKDKKRVSKEFIQKVATSLKVKLTISNDTHPFSGGIILHNENCDKNLTLDALIKQAEIETQSDVANILFT